MTEISKFVIRFVYLLVLLQVIKDININQHDPRLNPDVL